jgi:PBP1b-binding outer membrane lipoprotein LpoB
MKKIYITLALILPLFLMGCSIDSLIPGGETADNIESTITQIQDKVNTA